MWVVNKQPARWLDENSKEGKKGGHKDLSERKGGDQGPANFVKKKNQQDHKEITQPNRKNSLGAT